MFRFSTVPPCVGRQASRLAAVAANPARSAETARATRPATAEIRIRRLAEASVDEDRYSAILPSDGGSPIDLLRIITEACKDLPEFQIQNEDDERFVLSLTLKS
jgi:hypothetical protein